MSSRTNIDWGAVERAAGPAVDELIDKAMEAGVDSAQSLVPIDTGALRNDIAVIQPAADGVGTYGASLEYAEPVEFGTGRMAAQPYLRPSIDAMKRAL